MTEITALTDAIRQADAIIVGAGAGMSTAAGFDFWYENSAMFNRYFAPYAEKYHFQGAFNGFYTRFATPGEKWGFRLKVMDLLYHEPAPKPTYEYLKQLLGDKPYHIVTTNQDMVFKRYFPHDRISEIQGSWSYFQSSNPTTDQTLYPTKPILDKLLPEVTNLALPESLIPTSTVDQAPLSLWVRGPEFLEGELYQAEHDKWTNFMAKHQHERILFLELGVGRMTPMFIQEPFWALTHYLPNAQYITINPRDAVVHPQIADRSLRYQADIDDVLAQAVQLI